MAEVTLYSADWCSDCRRSKSLLNTLGVEYDLKDVEADKATADEAQAISGRTNIPVVRFADGEFMVEPSDADLHAALVSRGLVK
jgi:glutaredoxin-like protein